MCGHDWCSVRISKEIVEFSSGKAEGFVRERVMKSPALTLEQREILEKRGVLSPEEIHRLANKTQSALGMRDGNPRGVPQRLLGQRDGSAAPAGKARAAPHRSAPRSRGQVRGTGRRVRKRRIVVLVPCVGPPLG